MLKQNIILVLLVKKDKLSAPVFVFKKEVFKKGKNLILHALFWNNIFFKDQLKMKCHFGVLTKMNYHRQRFQTRNIQD